METKNLRLNFIQVKVIKNSIIKSQTFFKQIKLNEEKAAKG